MAIGYLVTLGDASLDAGDYISATQSTFTIDTTIGTGSWNWTGVWDGNGQTYSNITDTGVYYLGTDGNVYFIPDTWFTTSGDASVISAPPFTAGNGLIEGTAGDDIIDTGYTDDPEGERPTTQADTILAGAGNDTVFAGSGDDTVSGGTGNDTIYGGGGQDTIDGEQGEDQIFGGGGDDIITDTGATADVIEGGDGNDTIDAGAGDDTIYGDSSVSQPVQSESLNWISQGASGANLASGFTQDTGLLNVTVTFDQFGTNTGIVTSNSTQYVAGSDPFDTASALRLTGGAGPSVTANLTFEAEPGTGQADAASNITFRLNDVDVSAWTDVVTVYAYDANGDLVPVTLQIDGNDTLSNGGNTVTGAGGTNDTAAVANGSVLVTIPGPAHRVEIIYENAGTSTQALWITDVHFQTVTPQGDDTISAGAGDDTVFGGVGDDVIDGGTGADVIDAGEGDDTVTFAEGDTVQGGAGNDTFTLTDLGEATNGTITIDGGAGSETTGDTLDLGTLSDLSTLVAVADGTGSFSGSVTLDDGTLLNFSEIENIICFTPGTRIATPRGARDIAKLEVGDLVVTRDHGLQPIRWIQSRTVPAQGRFAPIRIRPGVVTGLETDILVSPQHRMLFQGYRAELLFGESEVLVAARHLVDGKAVTQEDGGVVTYIHMMFDEHEVVFAEGCATESFHPGHQSVCAVSDKAREELFTVFPHLRSDLSQYGQTARRCLKKHEARLLMT